MHKWTPCNAWCTYCAGGWQQHRYRQPSRVLLQGAASLERIQGAQLWPRHLGCHQCHHCPLVSLPLYHSGQSVLVIGLTAHMCVCLCICLCVYVAVIGLLYRAYPKAISYLPVHLPVCLSYICLNLCDYACSRPSRLPVCCQANPVTCK